MDPQKLVHMANQIGSFFEAESDRVAASESVANHIRRYWDPRMRRAIFQWMDTHGGEGLNPMVFDALKTRRELLLPKQA